jgi:hypothetical protein
LEDLYGHLLTHGQRLEQKNTATNLSISNVNFAQWHSNSSGKPQKNFSNNNRPLGWSWL